MPAWDCGSPPLEKFQHKPCAVTELAGMVGELMRKRKQELRERLPARQTTVVLTDAERKYAMSDCAEYNTVLGAPAQLFGFCSDFQECIYVKIKQLGFDDKDNHFSDCKPS